MAPYRTIRARATGGPIGAGRQLNTTGAEGGFATHLCDVEVDLDLGIVRVLRYTGPGAAAAKERAARAGRVTWAGQRRVRP